MFIEAVFGIAQTFTYNRKIVKLYIHAIEHCTAKIRDKL